VRLREHLRVRLGNGRDPGRVCSQCHPFFTGKQKLMDAAGRIDRFRKKYGPAKEQA